jgi:tetratricopeptide (TPR) repeat protein
LKTPAHPCATPTICVDEVQHALAAIVTSPAFSASPQLAAFLRFVVEAALDGQSDRIKGYTIAVEALGRDASFDPQSDPIVRVEAGRLRRALDRYYAEAGQSDPVAIELPRGSYVPVFRRRHAPAPPPPTFAGRLAAKAAGLAGPVRGPTVWFVLAIGVLGYAFVDLVVLDQLRVGREWQAASSAQATRAGDKRLHVGPSIYIAPISVSGDPAALGQTPAMLEGRLRDVFARFDDVTVISELASAGTQDRRSADYRLVTGLEQGESGTLNLRFQLIDAADGSVAWTRLVERLDASGDPRSIHVGLARDVANELLQPFGALQARERAKLTSRRNRDPGYACLLESFRYFRDFDRSQHAHIRECLEEATARDPSFASGFSSLARLYLREYLFGWSENATEHPLDKALETARHAIDVNPGNIRAYYVLIDVHMTRGEIAEAMAAGERVMALNPYDSAAVFQYAAQLVLVGDVERGMRIIRDNVRFAGTTPVRYVFIQAMAAYLKSDFATALAYANQLTNEQFPLGLVLQAATRIRTGDREHARAAAARLAELHPAWRRDPRRELKKFLPLPWVVDSIESDLREAGFGEAMASLPGAAYSPTPSPTILVEPIEIQGTSALTAGEATGLQAHIVGVFSRFEDIEVMSPPPLSRATAGANFDYRLAVVVNGDEDKATITAKLIDGEDGSALWSRTYVRTRHGDAGAFAFVGQMAAELLPAIGVVANHERLRVGGRPGIDRYRCMLEAADYLRSFLPARHAKARACLEEAVADDPGFASGFTNLARVYLREHQFSIQARPDRVPPIERARAAAERAISLNPNSARAHFAMFEICGAMGDADGVRRHGELALILNPHDDVVAFHYGLQLIMAGDVDAGLPHVRRVADGTSVPPARLDFALFLASYLKGDMTEASRRAKRITNDAFVPGHVARVLIARRSGDTETVRRMVDRLAAVDPGWRRDPRAQLARFITSPALVERLARDLAAAGLGPPLRASQVRFGRDMTVR